MSESTMTRSEYADLQRLVRQREKVLKSAAKQRSAELMADFENQLSAEYSFDNDAVWNETTRLANIEIKKANQAIAARCAKLGVPERHAPKLSVVWNPREYDNSVDKRRAELRLMAKMRIDALEKQAMTKIEMSCLQAQEEIAAAGLTSDAACTFIGQLPKVEELMPQLSFNEIAGESKQRIVDQLISPNALRQRRYRERHRNDQTALRNGSDTSEAALPSEPFRKHILN